MPLTTAYRTSYSRALFKNAASGFNARSLDADDWAFIESVRERGYIGGSGLGDLQRHNGAAYLGYWTEEDAVEAYALQATSDKLRALNETNKPKYFSVDDSAAEEESEDAKREHEQERIDRALRRARRLAIFARAAKARAEEFAELERVNHEVAAKARARELQTAEMEFDWARIERDQLVARSSRDRRNKRLALKAAERELRRATKFLHTMQRRIHEYDDGSGQGYPRHPGQDEQDLGAGRGQDDLSGGSQAADQPGKDDAGIAEGGHCGSPPSAVEDSAGDSGSRVLAGCAA